MTKASEERMLQKEFTPELYGKDEKPFFLW
jgi:hypothetical protein